MFSRRKLESNWDRYQDSEKVECDDDTPTVRGTDFDVLLAAAGKVLLSPASLGDRHQRLVSSANLNRLTLLICLLRCALTTAEIFPSAHSPLSLMRLFFFLRFLCICVLIGEESVCLLSLIAVRGRCCRVAAAHVLISPRWLVSAVRVCVVSSLFSQPFIFPPKVRHPVKRFFCVLAKPNRFVERRLVHVALSLLS